MDKLLAALKRNRHGHRDWLIGLIIYRHGLRVSEACDLRWDDIDLPKRTIIVRRLERSTDSVLELAYMLDGLQEIVLVAVLVGLRARAGE